ncbi:PA2778 family cysteine peptidase [Marinobacter sp.]|uniref:PA2778 family cysteine peptidase n=1 Tax=Marinobacter sp. TaxID=50741 RepID=UPI002B4818A2|nr:PA2778 family cysteine peptidase [Marinobacter sp.]HKK56504.1 PA2778 family cysteine peptidase [Marinobacter sp.]
MRALTGALVLLMAGCASIPPWPDRTGGADNEGGEAPVRLAVPFFPQQRYQCGPAALASMLTSQDVAVTPEQLVPRVYLPERQGSLKVELVAAARQYGLLVYPLAADLAAILAEIDAGHPVLVMQNLGFDWFPQWHFAVVIGYDPAAEELVLHTDTRRANRQSVNVFYRTWDRAGQWSAVILPPGDFPATAQPLPYLEAAHDLELTSQSAAAFAAYQAAAEQWPEEPAARLGMGNIAFAKQEWVEAVGYYADTVRKFPGLASGWNNLAHALARAGCGPQAGVALACANQVGLRSYPDDLPVSGSSQETPSEGFSCPLIQCPVAD